MNGPRWTIDELGAAVAVSLASGYEGAPNGRVRDVPDLRTIRYYTTLGLLDRPVEMRGRTALYGRRHLWQLVAIKRLQARGLSLTEIQQRLLGVPDRELRKLAQVPDEEETERRQEGGSPKEAAATDRRSGAFWGAPPAPAKSDDCPAPAPPAPVSTLQGVTLDDGITLLLPASRPLDDDDLQAIRAVAAPLLKLLERRRLLARAPERDPDD
jgi:DNA-binding transcriptional MerR regulator